MSGHSTYIPLKEIFPWWPDQLFHDPGFSGVAVTGYQLTQGAGFVTATLDLAIGQEQVITPVGLEQLAFVLPGPDIRIEAEYTGDFELRVSGFTAKLRLTTGVLVPVDGAFPDWIPRLDPDGEPEPIEMELDIGELVVDSDFSPYFEITNQISLSPEKPTQRRPSSSLPKPIRVNSMRKP